MKNNSENTTRKKFILWSVAAVCSATVLKFFTRETKKKDEGDTVKMLTQDGTLVEINTKLITQCGGTITNAELQKWVKTKPNKS
ncbi:hypothetical protein [Emticicia sp. SJ17W-69]|uniref:hypothetical protein n=1 Tax=Emticicia sp. SJ17W-69 TaxID=3421657 RepID=UPI003EBAE8AA